jgi:Ribosomal silencing factor during starvation
MQTANWILMDYGDVVFHVFQEQARRFYALERLWGDAPNETGIFGASVPGGAPAASGESKRPS